MLVLGTKLEVIVATMALQLQSQNSVIKGSPVVQPNDDHFWFNQPKFVLSLLHLVLFMWQYGIKSCYHESTAIIIIRVVLAVTVQVLCSYITLPLYALVTQMGSQYKSTGLEEQTVHAIKQWYAETRDRRKNQQDFSQSGRDSSSNYESSSNRTIGSPESSSHRRILSFAHENTHRSNETEIVEESPEILQDDQLDDSHAMVSSDMVRIELSEISKAQN
ncbi:MLO-like protein 3 [Morella rubra]|uniref:MLO-like protein 3 n=1 Tax=Morella rubra TaxID=262757 RepID=A0A6A1URA0_9ROSI|nr:MLO-like protein 3 [Morella rubra]